ncbi:short-chain dehydrogenases/reductases family (SDR) protein [Flavobacteria bacterium BBFL7]|nr:short-chain dehydrogenases/reductases family (SDR) protein [Flavobacteria bacterium BBFL7]
MEINLHNKTALVCGSSAGIGKATAQQFASAGARVILLARNEDKLKTVLQTLDQSHGQNHDYLVADFSKPDELSDVINAFAKANPIHILINNTGGPAAGWLIDAEVSALESGFTQHIKCNQILAKACFPSMKEAGYGRIINIISTSVKAPIDFLGVSNVIRGAVANWAKTLSNELGPHGITVNNVLPGFTATERLDAIIKGKAQRANHSEDEAAAIMKSYVPVRRFAEADEVANAITFLASEKASYINGINLPVDGGRTKSL